MRISINSGELDLKMRRYVNQFPFGRAAQREGTQQTTRSIRNKVRRREFAFIGRVGNLRFAQARAAVKLPPAWVSLPPPGQQSSTDRSVAETVRLEYGKAPRQARPPHRKARASPACSIRRAPSVASVSCPRDHSPTRRPSLREENRIAPQSRAARPLAKPRREPRQVAAPCAYSTP